MGAPDINPFARLVRMMMGQPSSPPTDLPIQDQGILPQRADVQTAMGGPSAIPDEAHPAAQMIPVNEQRPDPYQMLNEVMARIPAYYPPAKRTKGELIATFLQPAAAGFVNAMSGPRYQRNRRFWGGAVGSAAPLALQEAYRPEIIKQQTAAAQLERVKTAADIMRALQGYYRQRVPARVWGQDPTNDKQQVLYEIDEYGQPRQVFDAMGRPVTQPTKSEQAGDTVRSKRQADLEGPTEVKNTQWVEDPSNPKQEILHEIDKYGQIRVAKDQDENPITRPPKPELARQTAESTKQPKIDTAVGIAKGTAPIREASQKRVAEYRESLRSVRPTASDKKDAKAAKVFDVSKRLVDGMEAEGDDASKDPVAFYRRAAKTIEGTASDPRSTPEQKALVDPILRRVHSELTRRYPRQKSGLDAALRDILSSPQ